MIFPQKKQYLGHFRFDHYNGCRFDLLLIISQILKANFSFLVCRKCHIKTTTERKFFLSNVIASINL
jgi:hypothetical protein